jgi:hypothetical protein
MQTGPGRCGHVRQANFLDRYGRDRRSDWVPDPWLRCARRPGHPDAHWDQGRAWRGQDSHRPTFEDFLLDLHMSDSAPEEEFDWAWRTYWSERTVRDPDAPWSAPVPADVEPEAALRRYVPTSGRAG